MGLSYKRFLRATLHLPLTCAVTSKSVFTHREIVETMLHYCRKNGTLVLEYKDIYEVTGVCK